MKLRITTLTMIVISLGANSYTIEKLYENCKPFQNNGFSFEDLSPTKTLNATACFSYLSGLRDRGIENCKVMDEFGKRGFFDKRKLEVLSTFTANKMVDVKQIIASFTNYAENNTENWQVTSSIYAYKFISKKFPCKLEE